MSGHQQAAIGDTVFFWFASNDTSGSGGDGATPLFDVREAGAAASAAPLLSGTPSLLTNAAYPAGCHEIAVAATVGNGFAVDDTFSVFCTIAIDSQNPSGIVGSCTLTPLATGADLAVVDGNVDLILVDTNEIGVAGAGLTNITLNAASIDLVWDEVLTGGTHNVSNSAGRRLRQLQEAGGYGGFVWVDTADGTAGTTSFENGTDTLPVLTLADALTIAANVNLKNFMATRDTVMAPVADFNNFSVYGTGYTFTLGGFDYAGTHIFHASPLTGTATSTGNSDHFDALECIVGAVTVDDAHFTSCAHTADITLSGVGTATPGQLRLVNCFSLVANDGDVAIDFGTGSENHDVNIIDWQGNLQLTNFNVVTTGGTDTINITGMGKLLIDATCDAGTIYLRGHWDIQDNSGGAVTITQDDPATDINSLNLGIIYGSAVTGTLSTTQATSDLTGYADDQLIGRVIIFTSGAAEGEGTDITDYASASGLLTFTALTTAPGNTDTFKIV